MNTKKLCDSLIVLANKILQEASAIQDSEVIQKVNYKRILAKKIDYRNNSIQYDFTEAKQFDVWKWQSSDFEALLSNAVRPSSEYKAAVATYTSTFGYSLEGATVALHTFCKHFIDCASEGPYPHTHIERYITAFVKECSTPFEKLSWTIELWLGNIYIESEEVEISSNVFLRRATLPQLDQVVQASHYFEEFERVTSHVVSSTVILSFPVETEWSIAFGLNDPQIRFQIEQWLNVLRLFKPSSLYIVRQMSIQESLFGFQMLQSKGSPNESFLEGKIKIKDTGIQMFTLAKNEETRLKSFTLRVKPALKNTSLDAYLSGNALDLAIHRYTDALTKSEVIANKVLSSITSLDALLNEDKKKITASISSRTAGILSHYGFEYHKVSRNMRKAYDLRSRLVHGDRLEKGNLLEFATQYWVEIIEYNRLCILTFLFLQDQVSTEDLIAMIDASKLNQLSRTELASLVQLLSKLIHNPAK